MCFDVLDIFSFLGINVAREIEVVFLFLYLIATDETREFRIFQFTVPRVHNLANVPLTQTVLVAIFNKSFGGIDHKDAFAFAGTGFIQDNNARWNAGPIEKVGWQADNAF